MFVCLKKVPKDLLEVQNILLEMETLTSVKREYFPLVYGIFFLKIFKDILLWNIAAKHFFYY